MKNVLKMCLGVVVAMSMALSASAADEKGKIEGKVLGKDGNAAADVNVRVMEAKKKDKKDKDKAAPTAAAADEKEKGKDKEKGPKPVAKTKSGTDGTFSMADIPVGDYFVVAMTKDKLFAREKVTVKKDETAKVELKLSDEKPGDKKDKKKKGE